MSEADELGCAWCQRVFMPRVDGGRLQRFCAERCRRSYDSATRKWVDAAIAGGSLILDALKNGAARTSVGLGGTPRGPLFEPANPNPEAEALLTAIVVALGNLESDDFAAVIKLLGPRLTRRLFTWLDRAGA